jgi:hypothetical protein
MRLIFSAVLLTALAAPLASAQYASRRGSDRPEDALALPPRPAPGVAALVLEHASELALADSQRVVLESIRRTQDSANRPWILALDSLRPTRRPVNQNDLSQEQRDEIEARRTAIARVMEAMRETNALARQHTMAVLSPPQQEKAAELENDARKKAEDDRARQGRSATAGEERRGGGRGRRGGGMGGPED